MASIAVPNDKDATAPDVSSPSPAPAQPAATTTTTTTTNATEDNTTKKGKEPERPKPTDQGSSSSRLLNSPSAKATGRFLSAFGKTAVGMHPLWLMSEAVQGKKIGSQARSGSKELVVASQALRELLATNANDIVIIVNEQLRQKGETVKTADVIKKAGDDALVVVTSSIEKAQDQLRKNSPAIKRSIQKNGKEAIIVIDKALKHPLVITGVTKFAQAQGIPRPEAILTVASLALSKILATFPTDEELAAAEADTVDEIDAADLERTSTKEAGDEAKDVGKQAHLASGSGDASGSGSAPGSHQKGRKKDGSCIVM